MLHLRRNLREETNRLSLTYWVVWIILIGSYFVESGLIKPLASDSLVETPIDIRDMMEDEADIPLRPSFDQYKKNRSSFLQSEQSRAIGSEIKLNEREILANEVIQVVKKAEMDRAFADPATFAPAKHFFHMLNEIKNRDMFKLIQKMPKGGVLHSHENALASRDYIISLTYWLNLWMCNKTSKNDIAFKFSQKQPEVIEGNSWKLVSAERAAKGQEKFDEELKRYFSLYTNDPHLKYPNENAVWEDFFKLFARLDPILNYLPVWKAYFKQALKEFYEDGVQYLETRAELPDLYDLDGKIYKDEDAVNIFIEAIEEFKAEHPDFIGCKLIYAQYRRSNDVTFAKGMDRFVNLIKKYPKFIAGFDIQSQENTGRPLIDFVEQLLKLPKNINFYFHAGETNWNGMRSDENLIDAILMGTKRIGHGFAILNHPKVLEAAQKKSIAIELSPIANQVITLVDNIQNHPGRYLFAEGYPVVVSTDDRGFLETAPLSHDFYVAFMGIASAHADLRALKQLAINSLNYSAMHSTERKIAFTKWQRKWDAYIEWVISQRSKYNL